MSQYAFLLCFLCATFVLQWWQEPLYPLWLWLLLFEVVVIGWKKRFIAIGSIGVIIALVTVAHAVHIPSPNTIDWYANNEEVTVYGNISAEPDRRPMQTKYTVSTTAIATTSGVTHSGIAGNILVTDRRQWPEFRYGDTVAIEGVLERPERIETFYYDRYLSRYNIYSVVYRGFIHSLPNPDQNPKPIRLLHTLKSRFERQINRLYPEPHASFMAGLLTGSRRGIPKELMDDFNATGLTHIIAISGYNITIIITVIMGLLFFLPVRLRYVCTMCSIVCFVLFVGASAAVVRAGIMGIIGILALSTPLQTTVRRTVLLTATLMTMWNPKILWYDAGFQLSFLAVIGLMEIAPIIEPYCMRITNKLAIRESLMMTIAAQVTAVPLITVLFGRVSLIAPITNVLVAPAIPLAMLFGAVGTVVSVISMPIGLAVAYIGWAAMEWIVWVARIGASIPIASVSLHAPPWILLLYYLTLFIAICRGKRFFSPESTEPLLPTLAPAHEVQKHTIQF